MVEVGLEDLGDVRGGERNEVSDEEGRINDGL